MKSADHSVGPRKDANTACSALQSLHPSGPSTRTRRVPPARGSGGMKGQLTSTDASPSSTALTGPEPVSQASSAADCRQLGRSERVIQETRGEATGTARPDWYSRRTDSTEVDISTFHRWGWLR